MSLTQPDPEAGVVEVPVEAANGLVEVGAVDERPDAAEVFAHASVVASKGCGEDEGKVRRG